MMRLGIQLGYSGEGRRGEGRRGQKDSGGGGSGEGRRGQEESGRKDSGEGRRRQKESGHEESCQKESGQKESGQKDSGRKDSGRKDSGRKDSGEGDGGEGFAGTVDEVVEFEEAGAELVVVPEAYSFDAVSRLGFLAARTCRMRLASGVMQLYTRTPTLIAMTAAGLDHVSGGRFDLGLGASGPQVIEGFHGVRYDAPVARAREIAEICRRVWRREALMFAGEHYTIPLPGDYAKPLKIINHPVRPRIPILLAAMGPRNVSLAAEIAEGWQALWLDPASAGRVFGDALADGRSRRDPALGPLDISVPVPFAVGEPTPALLGAHRAQLALYLGGMGARGRNFSNDLVRRYGYAEEATRVQDLFLSGHRAEAIAAVPGPLVTATSLVGTPDTIRRRLDEFAAAGVTTLLASPLAATRAERVKDIAKLRRLLG